MKILQVINSLGTGGAEKLLLETIPLYRKNGIELDILLLWDNNHQFTQALQNLNICKIFILNNSSNLKDIYNPLNIFKMKKIMRNYDIVHVHLFPAQYFAVFANILNSGSSKLIFTEHNTSNTRISNKLFRPIEKFIYKRFARVVCITEQVRSIYKDYLGTHKNLVLINNGVDITKISSAEMIPRNEIHPSLRPGDQLVLQVSAFRIQKDQPTLIRAMLYLPNHFKLLLVGSGEKLAECRQLVNELHLGEKVFFLGQRMDISQLLKQVDIAVLSSHWEGFGLVSVEAMASGTPLVASDVPGLRDVVKDAGLLFKTGDYIRLSEIIKTLAEDPDYARSIAKKGYERALQFDIHKMVQKHIELYQEVDHKINK